MWGQPPRAYPEHPPRMPKAYPIHLLRIPEHPSRMHLGYHLQPLLKPVDGAVQGAVNPSPTPPQARVRVGLLPAAGGASRLRPRRRSYAHPHGRFRRTPNSFEPLGLRVLRPQGFAPTAVEPPPPQGRPPRESSVGPCGGRASTSPGRPSPLYKRDEPA
jgi:hypothetical protein